MSEQATIVPPIPEVSDLDLAFPTRALEILPPWKDIPQEFKKDTGKWCELVRTWFYRGLKNTTWTAKPGADKQKALRAVQACLGDWGPSQEHKMAGTAYLLSQWFEDATYEPAKG